MNFSRILSIYMLAAVIFCTPISAMQEQQAQPDNIFARSLNKVTSTLDKATDLFIKYALIKPAQMWFESQPESEQERIVLESEEDSLAHTSFKMLHSEQKYQELLEQKAAYSLINSPIFLHKNESTQLKTLGVIFLLVSPHFLSTPQYNFNNTPDTNKETEGDVIKMLSADFIPGNQNCQAMAYLQHNIDPLATPFDQGCYMLTDSRTNNQSTSKFIGCNPINNYFIRCFLVDPIKKIVFAKNLVLTGKPSKNYQCDPKSEKIYKIYNNLSDGTTILEGLHQDPQKIFGTSQLDFAMDCARNTRNDLDFFIMQNYNQENQLNHDIDRKHNGRKPLTLNNLQISPLFPSIENIFKHIMQNYNQENLNYFYIEKDKEIRASYNSVANAVVLSSKILDSLTHTVAALSHELGHKAQYLNFDACAYNYDALISESLLDKIIRTLFVSIVSVMPKSFCNNFWQPSNFNTLEQVSTDCPVTFPGNLFYKIFSGEIDAKIFNIEINADLLGVLSLFLADQPREIMPLMLIAYCKSRYPDIGSFVVDSEQVLDDSQLLRYHPKPPTRIAYTLEVIEKLEAAQENLLKSYELTMKNELNLASRPQ